MNYWSMTAVIMVSLIIGLTVSSVNDSTSNSFDVQIACIEKTGNRFC